MRRGLVVVVIAVLSVVVLRSVVGPSRMLAETELINDQTSMSGFPVGTLRR